jgi:hypothetical protein
VSKLTFLIKKGLDSKKNRDTRIKYGNKKIIGKTKTLMLILFLIK